ncbi:hypothetical protein INT44_003424 [Umbelopsis vinacea]|uniref:histidine kinase n=1 Tax=Umbelopsis vinacea TaxID=44442 RepID=A0A8H7PVB6_9FUNG|nr:hypothetical protein INT44_003424 [Umbelopsis vinacea]
MYGKNRVQQNESNDMDSPSTSTPNLQWFIMPETVLMTDANLIIETTITPNTKSFNQSLRGHDLLKLVADDEVQVIREIVKKTQIGDGNPVVESITRNRFMNDITYKISPVLDMAGNIVQYLITRTISSARKEPAPPRFMERKQSGSKVANDIEVHQKSSIGGDKILSKFIKVVENADPSVAAAIWLAERTNASTLHLVAFPKIRELIGVKVSVSKKHLDINKHELSSIPLKDSHFQTPELISKLADHNLFTESSVPLYNTSHLLVGLLVFYGPKNYQPSLSLKDLVNDATSLVESVISLEQDHQTSRNLIEERISTSLNASPENNATLIVDFHGRLQFISTVVRDMLGLSKSANVDLHNLENFVEEKDRHRVTSAVTKSKQNPHITRYVDCVEFHRRIPPKEGTSHEGDTYETDGFYLDLKIQGLWDDPTVNGCLIRARDVSPKAISDRQTLESQKSLAMTNNSLNEGLIRTDSEGIIEYVNLAFIKLIGMDEWMLTSRARPGSADSGSGSQSADLVSSSSSASESVSTDDDDQNVSLMTTLVGTPIDDLLQLIQVVIRERSPSLSASDTPGSTTVTDNSAAPARKHHHEKAIISSRSASPHVSEGASDASVDTKFDSSTSTDEDMFDDGFSYKTTLVDVKSMIKRTVVTKDTVTLADNKHFNACHEDVYSDVLTTDMMDIVNFQLGESDLGRSIGYLIRRGGETAVVAVEVTVNPLQRISYKRSKARAHSKNTDGVVLVFRNMTEVMRTQSANRQLADKSRWISVITHEMRSLVNGIIGMLDLVKTTKLSKEQTGLVDCMEVSANALICLVSNTLDHARLEAGKVSLEYLPFNMQERLRIVVDLMNMMAEAKDVKFSAEIDEDVPETMYSDFNRLFQILLNLTSNAIKFSSHKRKHTKQGQVKLIVKKLDEEYKPMSPLAVNTSDPMKSSKFASMLTENDSTHTNPQRYRSMLSSNRHPYNLTSPPSPSPKSPGLHVEPNRRLVQLLFVVEDNGIGISPRDKEKLFQEFGQAEVSISRRYGGSGMGLFICKQLVRLFNGTIGCESTLGEGSQFWFTAWFQSSEVKSAAGSDSNNYFSMEQAMLVNNSYDNENSSSNQGESTESGSDTTTNDVSSEEASDSNQGTTPHPRHSRKVIRRKEDLRILIAEDDRINQQVLQKFCQGLGYPNVTVVGDGRSAVKKCNKRHFDIVLMDKSMPIMGGMDAVQAIRNGQAGDRDLHITLISGDTNIDYGRYRDLNINGHLVKPIRMPDLKRELDRFSASALHSTGSK